MTLEYVVPNYGQIFFFDACFMAQNSFARSLDPMGTAVAQWLRCCATNRKVAGSIPSGVTGIFH